MKSCEKKKKAGLIFVKMSENNTLHTLQLWTRSAAEAAAHSRRYSKHSEECLIALACVCVRVCVFSKILFQSSNFFTVLITR